MSESKVVRVDLLEKRLREQIQLAKTAYQKVWGHEACQWQSRIITLRGVLALLRELGV